MSADRPAGTKRTPRLRSAPAWAGLGACLLLGAFFFARDAPAQSLDTNADSLFRPRAELAGGEERFRRGSPSPRPDGRSRFGDVRPLGPPPGSGAGSTGFDSTNAVRRKLRPAVRARPARPPAATAAGAPAVQLVPVRPVPQPARRGARAREMVETTAQVPTIATPTRRNTPVPQDPYEPLGLRSGGLTLFPAVELTGGYDTNPAHINTAKGSATFIVAPELRLRSDWQRHALTADIKANYQAYSESFDCCTPNGLQTGAPRSLDRPFMDSKVDGRLDITRDNRIETEGRVQVGTDNPGSPNITAGLARLPIYTMFGGTLGYVQRFNRFEVTAKGAVDRRVYEQSLLTDGSYSDNSDRNYNQYAGALRGSYDLLPGVKPFVEVDVDSRVHDFVPDRTNTDRDSTGQVVRAGSTFEFSKKLTGELSVGYLMRRYKDPTLNDINGFVFDSSLIWRASPLTTLTLTAKSTVDEIILPGVSGALRRDFGFQVDHAFRRWLIGTAKFGYGLDDYVGMSREDQRFFVSTGLIYKLNREVQLKGEWRRDWLKSNQPGVDYTADLFTLGVRLQR